MGSNQQNRTLFSPVLSNMYDYINIASICHLRFPFCLGNLSHITIFGFGRFFLHHCQTFAAILFQKLGILFVCFIFSQFYSFLQLIYSQ